ncbi:MAG: DUF2189 domain-containing protein [Aliishimia sp.]
MDAIRTDQNPERPLGVPELRAPTVAMLARALKLGWQDFMFAPGLGLFFGLIYVLAGWGIAGLTLATGHSFWLVLAAVGFPLVGPFAAVGLYEMSHRIEQGIPLAKRDVFSVVWHQRGRQLPWICVLILILFLFWFFLGHMIFALFLGLTAMTNVSSSWEVYTTSQGLSMLAVGTAVGAGFALLLFAMSVLSLPLLLDREVDFVTGMVTSIVLVRDNLGVMLLWAAILAGMTFLALLPGFIGLLVVFPWLGHASWHIYSQLRS